MKTLGATRAFTLSVSLTQLVLIGLIAAIIGSLIGFGAQAWLVKMLAGWLRGNLPPPGLAPLGIGFLTAIAVLGGFALPPLLQLSRTPALRVLRRDVGPPAPLVILAFGPAVLAIAFLIYWVMRDLKVFTAFVGGTRGFRAGGGRGRLAARQTNYPAARWCRRVVAIRHRESRAPPDRKRGAAHRVRTRHHDAAGAHGGAQRPAQRLATQLAGRIRPTSSSSTFPPTSTSSSRSSSRSAAPNTCACGPWFARA